MTMQSRIVGKDTLANGEISGYRVFLWYAFPCADIRIHRRLINHEQFEKLAKCVDGDNDPPPDLLAQCFPNAVKTLVESARVGAGERQIWGVEHVKGVWRAHVGSNAECAVISGTVVRVKALGALIRKSGGQQVFVFNRYGFSLAEGGRVWAHKSVIAEFEEE